MEGDGTADAIFRVVFCSEGALPFSGIDFAVVFAVRYGVSAVPGLREPKTSAARIFQDRPGRFSSKWNL